VGFGVGVVERTKLIDGSSIRADDVLLGLGASGFHSNGYSLVRHVLETGIQKGALELFGEYPELKSSLASELLAPTRIYVKPLLNVLRDFTVNGLCHVTGGGFAGNVPRVLPKGVRARIDPRAWPRPGVYAWIQRHGEIDEAELLRVFNCGIGMIVVAPAEQAEDIVHRLGGLGERAYRIGVVERKSAGDDVLVFDPGCLDEGAGRSGRA
jgi:phosphoribosylformylglycinamidine cyclo-ligase